MEECKKIVIYDYDCDGFKHWIRKIASEELNEKLSHELLEKIREEILSLVNSAIQASCVKNAVQHSIECKNIGRGATSVCYQSIDIKNGKRIFKKFHPIGFKYQPIRVSDIISNSCIEFQWLEKSSSEQELKFLKRFIRFILQEDEIEFAKSKTDSKQRNFFIAPKLVLSSIGLIYQAESFFGETLNTVFKYHNDDKIKEIRKKINLVKSAAKYVQRICHQNNIYHGDIKPSNFFAIGDIEKDCIVNIDLIQNIDFDTWVHAFDSETQVLTDWDMTATTPLYYYADIEKVKSNQTFSTLQAYDIRALSRMLMYAMLCVFDLEKDIYKAFESNKAGFDWVDYFFIQSNVGARLFAELTNNIENQAFISALYIFESIKALIVGCTVKVKRSQRIFDINTFIEKVEEIEKLLQLYSHDYSVAINANCIRYLGLKRLDAERGDKPLRHAEYDKLLSQGLSCDWVQYVIEQNYYKQKDSKQKDSKDGDEQGIDLIDRHLLPDIKWGNSDKEKVQYEFDENDNPITASPLKQMLDPERFGNKSLFLTAEGGQGKTTTLRSFWLDFLSGKHNISCLYVDGKLLSANKGDAAIKEYIKQSYCVILDKGCVVKPILLIDSANESNVYLRKRAEAYCYFVDACNDLINIGHRIVIGSRSDIVTMTDKDYQKDKQNASLEREFGKDTMQYVFVCKLHDEQIEHCLRGTFKEIKDKQPLIDLLRNNMMLHIFMNLELYGIELDQKDMKAGILLDKYFQICFRMRYVKSCIKKESEYAGLSELELYSIVRKIDEKGAENENEGEILNAAEQYDIIVTFLMNNCMKYSIDSVSKEKNIYSGAFENLSILVKDSNNYYTWANEIYQEYFHAVKLKDALQRFNEDVLLYDLTELVDLFRFVKYNSLQFAGELLEEDRPYFNNIISYFNIFLGDDDFQEELINGIMRLSVLCGNGIPKGITRIGWKAFSHCTNIIRIEIPNDVKVIDNEAFAGCSNLTSIDISNSVEVIGSGAFRDCIRLMSVKLPNGVKKIGGGVFAGCSNLTSVNC